MTNHNLTWSRQRAEHFMTQFRHCVQRLLFNVQVLLWTLTVMALTGHTDSHLPHNLHFLMSLPTRHLDL